MLCHTLPERLATWRNHKPHSGLFAQFKLKCTSFSHSSAPLFFFVRAKWFDRLNHDCEQSIIQFRSSKSALSNLQMQKSICRAAHLTLRQNSRRK
jgi:predicted DNA-binding protein (MmcQ/YjbR family)